MDKVGIARGLFYYYYGDIWKKFFDELNVEYEISPRTNRQIMDMGLKKANDEMCLSLKTYLGHICYLKDRCTYLLVPRICNYNSSNQTCTNFWAIYDIVNNLFDKKVLTYNIDLDKKETLKKGLFRIGTTLGKSKLDIKKAYIKAMKHYYDNRKKLIDDNYKRLNSKKVKILIVSHPYNTYDDMIGGNIVKYLKSNDIEVIFSDRFDTFKNSGVKLSKDLYFKYSKESLGGIVKSYDKIDGIIFVSSFPCAPDSLVNELVIRKIKKPCINIIIDESEAFTALETRLESFIDMIRRNAYV